MTDTPLRDASRERRREVWILYSIAGMIIEGFAQAMSAWKPWGGESKWTGRKARRLYDERVSGSVGERGLMENDHELMEELSEDEKIAMTQLRQLISDDDRNALDNVTGLMMEKGFNMEEAMFIPYIIYSLGIKFATDTGFKCIETRELRAGVYYLGKEGGNN